MYTETNAKASFKMRTIYKWSSASFADSKRQFSGVTRYC